MDIGLIDVDSHNFPMQIRRKENRRMRAYWTSNSDEYSTPQELFDELDAEFNFNLDPCSTDENAKCEKHYTKADDGLSKSWGGAECSAIHHIAELRIGLRNVTEKEQRTIQLLFC